MLLHSAGSSAPAACGSSTEIAPTVAPHRNSSPAARAITRLPSRAPEPARAASEPRTAATTLSSTAPGDFPTPETPQKAGALTADGRSGGAQRVFAVRVALDVDDEALLEPPHRGAVFADVTALARHGLASADIDLLAEIKELVGLEPQVLGRQPRLGEPAPGTGVAVVGPGRTGHELGGGGDHDVGVEHLHRRLDVVGFDRGKAAPHHFDIGHGHPANVATAAGGGAPPRASSRRPAR